MKPVVWVFAHMRNEAAILPFWLRHYSAFADRIVVYDDGSNDGTLEALAMNPRVHVADLDMGGIYEDALLWLAHESYPIAAGQADYCMWVDADEFIYHPKMLECLAWHKAQGHEVIETVGFNMMGSGGIPADDGHSQLTDIYRTGVRAPIYSKPVVFDPRAKVSWSRGKHTLMCPGMVIGRDRDEYKPNPWRLKLLHYRFLTPEYTAERNARQYERVGVDKGAAWSCAPTFTGEHSAAWVERTMHLARDVVDLNACYLPGVQDA